MAEQETPQPQSTDNFIYNRYNPASLASYAKRPQLSSWWSINPIKEDAIPYCVDPRHLLTPDLQCG